MDNEYLEEFRKAVQSWTDERFVSKKQLWAMSMFILYLVNLSEEDGWAYAGHSLKMATPMCCLTVKAWDGDLPVVVFNSGRTPMACVSIFIRKLEAGVLEWRPDRYRQ